MQLKQKELVVPIEALKTCSIKVGRNFHLLERGKEYSILIGLSELNNLVELGVIKCDFAKLNNPTKLPGDDIDIIMPESPRIYESIVSNDVKLEECIENEINDLDYIDVLKANETDIMFDEAILKQNVFKNVKSEQIVVENHNVTLETKKRGRPKVNVSK